MKKRFVVIVDSSTDAQNENFLAWIKSQKVGWWHWFQNVWLISNKNGHLTASVIRDSLREYYGTANNLVLELRNEDDTWSGFGPKGEGKNMFKWLKSNW